MKWSTWAPSLSTPNTCHGRRRAARNCGGRPATSIRRVTCRRSWKRASARREAIEDTEPEPSLKYRNRHSRESGNDDQGKTFRTLRPCRHAMTNKFDRRSALKRLGAAGVGLSLPAWLGGCAPPVVRNARARRPNVSSEEHTSELQ